ncbi:hypothetical protein V6Z12_A08G228300 [Gossypium hirsutum]
MYTTVQVFGTKQPKYINPSPIPIMSPNRNKPNRPIPLTAPETLGPPLFSFCATTKKQSHTSTALVCHACTRTHANRLCTCKKETKTAANGNKYIVFFRFISFFDYKSPAFNLCKGREEKKRKAFFFTNTQQAIKKSKHKHKRKINTKKLF